MIEVTVRSRLWADYNKVQTHAPPENELNIIIPTMMLVCVTTIAQELHIAFRCVYTKQVLLLLSDLIQHTGVVLAKYTWGLKIENDKS